MLPTSRNLRHFEKRFRNFNANNFGSVGQRASKLLAFKVGVLKKNSAASATPPKLCAIAFGPGSNPGAVESFQSLTARNFEEL